MFKLSCSVRLCVSNNVELQFRQDEILYCSFDGLVHCANALYNASAPTHIFIPVRLHITHYQNIQDTREHKETHDLCTLINNPLSYCLKLWITIFVLWLEIDTLHKHYYWIITALFIIHSVSGDTRTLWLGGTGVGGFAWSAKKQNKNSKWLRRCCKM